MKISPAKMTSVRLLFILSLFAVGGCTEEVSEKLKNSQTTMAQDSSSLETVTPAIRLKHDMDESSSFVTHKGGDTSAPCELKEPSQGFLSDEYSKTSPTHTLDCVMEAQELDLYAGGAKFTFEGDDNLCAFYEYVPFKFVEMPMGDTTKAVYNVTCTGEAGECGASECDNVYEDFDGASTFSNVYANGSTPSCRFDYTEEEYGKNCDEGNITTHTYQIDNTMFDSDNDGDPDCAAVDLTPVKVGQQSSECGGDHYNCMGGPSIAELGSAEVFSHIYSNLNRAPFTEAFEIEAPIERWQALGLETKENRYLANYSSAIANSCSNVTGVNSFSDWSTDFAGHDIEDLRDTARYEPAYLGDPSYNLKLDADGNEWDGIDDADVDAISYAENPFRSYYNTSPYYAFNCLDSAFDVKAQIRLFIREWDREYPESNGSRFDFITDSNLNGGGTNAFIDSTESNLDGEDWNNVTDWDDFFTANDVWSTTGCYETRVPFSVNNFPGKL
ncbi:MAG: hypothetical protein WD025_01840 [Bacteriovoracaceae bacterium]